MITIKIGGSVVDDLHPSVIDDIKKVVAEEGVILVHGGGKEVTKVTTVSYTHLTLPTTPYV